jgi:hypothetical protein
MEKKRNLWVIPTDKPSRLFKHNLEDNVINISKHLLHRNYGQNIYITSSNEEIKEGSIVKIPCGVGRVKELHWKYGNDFPSYIVEDLFTYKLRYGQKEGEIQTNSFRYEDVKKIILTTDQDLIKDGVQAIDDEFLEWFVKNSSCESVEVQTKITKDGVWTDLKGYVELPTIHSIKYKIIIPKEELCSCTNKCIDNTSNICKGVKTTCIQCDGTGETTTSNTYNSQRKCDLCNGRGYWNKEIIPKEEPKQKLPIVNGSYGCTIETEKQETLEYGLLQHIKFCLECGNEAQAIRLIEKYGFEKQEQDKNKYSEEEVLKLWNWLNDGFIIRKSLPTREELIGWFEQFKKK